MKKKHLLYIIINALCLAGVIFCQILSYNITSKLHPGQAAKAWAGQSGERYAEFAVYFPATYDFNEMAQYQLRDKLDTAFKSASVESIGNSRIYIDAWSAQGSVTVTGERGNAEAFAIGTGGDFFYFHPLILRSGSYFSQSDVMRDRVVIDEELAWRLYGSVNLAGLEVVIKNRPFVIAGVVARETDKASQRAYPGGAGIYMSYELFKELAGEDAHINCYEIVLPDPVTDFAYSTLKTAFSDETFHYTDNTSRFSLSRIFNIIKTYGERSMRIGAVAYPYWENAARYAEDRAALLLAISLVLLVCPAVFAAVCLVGLILLIIREIKDSAYAYMKRRDDRAYKRYLEKQKG